MRPEAGSRPAVVDFVTGEWMRYSVEAAQAGHWTATIRARSAKGGTIALGERRIALPASTAWQDVAISGVALPAGTTPLILRAVACGDCAVESLTLARRCRAEPPRALRARTGQGDGARSETRRVGRECVRTCRSRQSRGHPQKTYRTNKP